MLAKQHINVLGIIPNLNRVSQFVIGFIIITIIVLINIYVETSIRDIKWESKPIDFNVIFKAFIYHFKSALTEDLVFRGAILYILIQRIGAQKAFCCQPSSLVSIIGFLTVF